MKNIITVYACGGAGINIGAEIERAQTPPMIGMAGVRVGYIDTSDSNVARRGLDVANAFLFEGKDGSGSVRRANAPEIIQHTPAVLQRWKPTALNIVIHSAAGGSGSVLGPSIMSELINRGENAIAVVVGGSDTKVQMTNTLDTLKSYENIASVRQAPVVVCYFENGAGTTESSVNAAACGEVGMLCGLFSGENERLDSADLRNWLRFLQFTGGEPRLTTLKVLVGEAEVSGISAPDSVITLALPDTPTRLPMAVPYQKVGIVPAEWAKPSSQGAAMIGKDPIHYVLSGEPVAVTFQRLTKALADWSDSFTSRVARPSILGNDSRKAEGNGLIL